MSETYGTGGTWGTSGRFEPHHFRKGMDIYGSDDHKFCTLDDVHGRYLFCTKGLIFKEDAYIPMSYVSDVREDRIYLSVPKDQIDQFGWTEKPQDWDQPYFGQTGGTPGKFQGHHFRKGMDVYGADDQKFCTVDEVYGSYLMCKKGMMFKEDAYIPFSAVRDVREDRVYLSTRSDELDKFDWTHYPTDLGQPYYGETGGDMSTRPYGQE